MGDPIRVLVVDDDSDVAELTVARLENADDRISVTTATDASGGLDLLAEDTFDCVVSDYDMSGRSGIEFLKAVRERYPDLPFILYTGKGSEDVASDAISAGVTDYLQKAASMDQGAVLANRVTNADEHGGSDVTVTVGTTPDGFFVAEDGPGIPPEDRETVFDVGYSTSEDGTEFGLSIVEQVADAHGWEISVGESADGGARFEITGVEFVE